MTTRPYELLARFNAQGQVAGVHVRTLTNVNGRDYESDPEPLSGPSDPAFTAFATQFAAAAVAERNLLASQLAALTADHAAALEQIEQLETQLAAAQELADQLPTVTAERDTALAAKEAAEATLAEVQAELDSLKNPPTNVRRLPPYSFLRRYTTEERAAIRAARRTDDIIDEILFILTTVRYVDLDDQDTQQGVGYIAQQGLIAPNRVAEILADALPEEL